mmetsp:Transcript_38142/g.96500  ORF Transcript_38142/g.96500 Transcript_38142/m.96500 type:complete len:270 (-) Transcript_38142:713-1522(-)
MPLSVLLLSSHTQRQHQQGAAAPLCARRLTNTRVAKTDSHTPPSQQHSMNNGCITAAPTPQAFRRAANSAATTPDALSCLRCPPCNTPSLAAADQSLLHQPLALTSPKPSSNLCPSHGPLARLRRCLHVEVGAVRGGAHLLELLQDLVEVLLQVVVQRLHRGGLDAQQLVRLVHGRAPRLVVGQHLGKRQAVRRVLGPLQRAQDAARALEHHRGHRLHLGVRVGQLLAQRNHLLRAPRLGPRQRQRPVGGLVAAQRGQRHARRVLRVQV